MSTYYVQAWLDAVNPKSLLPWSNEHPTQGQAERNKMEKGGWRVTAVRVDALCFPGAVSGKEPACQCRRHGFDPWVGKIPGRRAWQPPPVFLPGEPHGNSSLAAYNPQVRKESDKTVAI